MFWQRDCKMRTWRSTGRVWRPHLRLKSRVVAVLVIVFASYNLFSSMPSSPASIAVSLRSDSPSAGPVPSGPCNGSPCGVNHVLRSLFLGLSGCCGRRSWFGRSRWNCWGFWLSFGRRCRCRGCRRWGLLLLHLFLRSLRSLLPLLGFRQNSTSPMKLLQTPDKI